MRCDGAQSPSARQIRSRLCQGTFFFIKTRRLDCTSPAAARMVKSQCRGVVGHLAVKIKFPLAEKRGGCVVGRCRAVGERLGRLDSVESWL